MKNSFLFGALIVLGGAGILPASALPTSSDLSVTKTAPGTAFVGDNLTYTITARNKSDVAASNVNLSDELPSGTTFVSATQTGGPEFSLTTPAVGTAGTVNATIPSLSGTTLVNTPQKLRNVNGTLFFSAYDSNYDNELWKSDGTAAGTSLVKNINPAGSSSPNYLVNLNGTLFFQANDGSHGQELWKSDGTAAGTVLVKDIVPGTGHAFVYGLTVAGGNLYFVASDGSHGFELWTSDGTEAGTTLVKDINPGSTSSYISNLTAVGNTLYFLAEDGSHGPEIWKSDGTETGTTLVKDIFPGGNTSNPSSFTNLNGTLFFSAYNPTYGYELWKSDGTEEGTQLVKDINPGSGFSSPSGLAVYNNKLYFAATIEDYGTELWTSDGTSDGTYLLKDINPLGSSDPANFFAFQGELFFGARSSDSGNELWKTDSTEEGTVRVKTLNYNSGTYPSSFTNVNGTLFFSANDDEHGTELWKSDGTEAGTQLIKDINLDGDSSPKELTNLNGTLFFAASDESGNALWKSDGTAAGTVPIQAEAEPATFEIVVKLGSNAAGTLSNTATISGDLPEPTPGDNSSTATTTVSVPDSAKPVPSISTPTANQNLSVAAFNTVTGSATDNVGVTNVFIKIIRTREGVRSYFNGTNFSEVPTLIPVTVLNPGATSTNWSYEVTPALKGALDDGPYAVYAYAQDAAGNLSGAYTRNFTLYTDSTKPTPVISTPTNKQTLSITAFGSITGSATDNVGVTGVQLKLFRTVNGTVQYWNGVDSFTPTPTLFSVTLANSGAKSTNWTYTVTPALKNALTAGSYLIYAYATDARNNGSSAVSRNFTLTGDDIKPSSPVISTPTQGQSLDINNFTTIAGGATDNVGVNQVLLRLYRTRGGVTKYWNGTAFTPTASTFLASLNAPDATSTSWTYTVTPQLRSALDAGAYGIQAYGRDASGNQSAAASRTFKLFISAAPPAFAPSDNSGSSANDS